MGDSIWKCPECECPNGDFRDACLNCGAPNPSHYLVEDEAITEEFAHRLLSWKHSGFSVDNTVGVAANDSQGRPPGL